MHARLTFVQIDPSNLEEATAIFRDSVVPAAKQQVGFERGYLLTDRATGKGIAITIWVSEANMKAGEGSGYYQQQLAKFAPLFKGPPVREVYEVEVQT